MGTLELRGTNNHRIISVSMLDTCDPVKLKARL